MASKGRVLGFDFGLKRIGVATGNSLTRTAQALCVVNWTSGSIPWKQLQDIIAEWKPERLVVGLPLNLDGKSGEMAKQAKTFGNKISNQSGLPVTFTDERYSSLAADQLLREITPAGKKIANKSVNSRDSLSAQLILQTYFEDN